MQKIPSNKESYEVIVSNQDNIVADNDDFESQVVQKKLLFVADVTSNAGTILNLLKTNNQYLHLEQNTFSFNCLEK